MTVTDAHELRDDEHSCSDAVGDSSTITVGLDRDPCNREERELVGGFPQAEHLDEIWVRCCPMPVNPFHVDFDNGSSGPVELMRIYLSFRIMTPEGRHMADRIEHDYRVRHTYSRYAFEFFHIYAGEIPIDLPARIWQRPKVLWTPTGEITV